MQPLFFFLRFSSVVNPSQLGTWWAFCSFIHWETRLGSNIPAIGWCPALKWMDHLDSRHCPFHLRSTPQASLTLITSDIHNLLCTLTSSPRGPYFLAFFQDLDWLTAALPQQRCESFLDDLLGHSQTGQWPLPTADFGCLSSTYVLGKNPILWW